MAGSSLMVSKRNLFLPANYAKCACCLQIQGVFHMYILPVKDVIANNCK